MNLYKLRLIKFEINGGILFCDFFSEYSFIEQQNFKNISYSDKLIHVIRFIIFVINDLNIGGKIISENNKF